MKKHIKKTAQKATVAMGLVSSFLSPHSQAIQPDIHGIMQEVKQTSQLLASQTVEENYFFSVLAKLNEKVALLNATVRAMSYPEQTIQDITFIDTGLNTLANLIRTKHLEFLKGNQEARAIFKGYTAEVFKFSVFTEKMREKTNHYMIVESQSQLTQSDLAELVARHSAQ